MMRNENVNTPQNQQSCQTLVISRFLQENPNASIKDLKNYLQELREKEIEEKFEEYKNKKIKEIKYNYK